MHDLVPDDSVYHLTSEKKLEKTGVLRPFMSFAQAFASVFTAALTGSLYYVAASPKDPAYVMAPVLSLRK